MTGCRVDGEQYRAMQFKKNVVMVTSEGEVFASDDNLREIVEQGLYYSPALGRFMARGVEGITLRYV